MWRSVTGFFLSFLHSSVYAFICIFYFVTGNVFESQIPDVNHWSLSNTTINRGILQTMTETFLSVLR